MRSNPFAAFVTPPSRVIHGRVDLNLAAMSVVLVEERGAAASCRARRRGRRHDGVRTGRRPVHFPGSDFITTAPDFVAGEFVAVFAAPSGIVSAEFFRN